MAIAFDKFSYLNFFRLESVENFVFWENVIFPDLSSPREDDIKYMIRETDRIDLLSYRFYGSTRLWWIIALANNMWNISTEFHAGKEIRIPSIAFLESIFIGTI